MIYTKIRMFYDFRYFNHYKNGFIYFLICSTIIIELITIKNLN